MKKILFAIAIVLTISLTANAQGRESFFSDWGNDGNDNGRNSYNIVLPSAIEMNNGTTQSDPGAPLGSGLLILTALGAGYAVARKKK